MRFGLSSVRMEAPTEAEVNSKILPSASLAINAISKLVSLYWDINSSEESADFRKAFDLI